MNKKQYSNKDRAAVLVAFFTNGALMATWVSRIPAMQSKLSLSEGALGLVLLGLSSGMLLALLISGGLIARMGSRKVLLIAALISCLSLPILSLASHPLLLFTSLLAFGGGISIMDMAMNEQAVLVERTAGKPMMSSFHAGYSVGGVAGALVGAGMAALPGIPVLFHFILVMLFFGAIVVLIYQHLQPTQADTQAKGTVFRLPERALWVMGAIAFSSAIGEGASADWSAVYLKNVLQTNASTAALGFAAFSLTMTLGRVFGDWLTSKWKPAAIVRAGGLTAALGFAAAVLTSNPWIAIAGFGLAGLGLANIIPLLFGAAGNLPGFPPGTGIAGVATIGYVGFLVGPPLIGTIAEIFSLRASFFIVALMTGTLMISAKVISVNNTTTTTEGD
ncbi:MAG: MFS transporter [Pelolinea sp.]|nr:MFS transporter [Pelolinea sp.]